MIEPVAADIALETEIPAISAVLSGKIAQFKKKTQSVYEIKPEFETEAEKERDRSNGYRAMHAIQQERQKGEIKLEKKVE